MSVFLLILKWIGIVLLWILGILLFIILYLLLAPFHLSVRFENRDTFKIDARIRSFLSFAGFRFYKDDGLLKETTIHLFWGAYKKVDREEDEKEDPGVIESENENPEEEKAENEPVKDPAIKEPAVQKETIRTLSKSEPEAEDELDKALDELDAENQSGSADEKKENRLDKIKAMISENNIFAIKVIVREVLILLKRLMPDKCHVDFEYSIGEPDLTGETFGAFACIPALLNRKNRIVPDFLSDTPYFKGFVEIKGKIFLIFVVTALVKVLIHKECRDLIFSK